MKALGDKRPDEEGKNKKKQRVGASPGARAQPAQQNPVESEGFDENVAL